tara:strand:- start:102 stop:521 length:420 start_codon:yes stop_codon:yes gene_type:complete
MNKMKNLLLTVISIFLMSFSFSQDKLSKDTAKGLKVNSAKAVQYLTKELRLDDKQRGIFMNVFAEYANNMAKAIQKASKTSSADKKNNNKEIHKYMLRFSTRRDATVKESLKKKQQVKYDDVIKSIHPFTLEVRSKKKK